MILIYQIARSSVHKSNKALLMVGIIQSKVDNHRENSTLALFFSKKCDEYWNKRTETTKTWTASIKKPRERKKPYQPRTNTATDQTKAIGFYTTPILKNHRPKNIQTKVTKPTKKQQKQYTFTYIYTHGKCNNFSHKWKRKVDNLNQLFYMID